MSATAVTDGLQVSETSTPDGCQSEMDNKHSSTVHTETPVNNKNELMDALTELSTCQEALTNLLIPDLEFGTNERDQLATLCMWLDRQRSDVIDRLRLVI